MTSSITDVMFYIQNNGKGIMELNKEYHRGIGKTTFICRMVMHQVIENVGNVVVLCKTMEDKKKFKDEHIIPAIQAEPGLRYRVRGDGEITVCGPYDVDISVRRPDTSIILSTNSRGSYLENMQWYRNHSYKVIEHDSRAVDLRMVNELKILKKPDKKLPLYVDHKWTYELLHQDYLERLKKNTSFAAVI